MGRRQKVHIAAVCRMKGKGGDRDGKEEERSVEMQMEMEMEMEKDGQVPHEVPLGILLNTSAAGLVSSRLYDQVL